VTEVHTIDVPFILGGKELPPSEKDGITLEYGKGETAVRFPRITPEDFDALYGGEDDLAALSQNDIFAFLAEVGTLWADPGYRRYRESFESMQRVTDFSAEELALDFSYIPLLLEEGGYLRRMLKTEFGDPAVLDRWTVRGGCEVKAVPRGRLLHVLAGNVPGVEIISIARGLMTKNANILKMARGNPITPVALVKSFADVDPDHPITRSTSVIYWERGSKVEEEIYRKVHSVCVWGGFDAVHASWTHARPGLEILDYGPKRSMVFIGSSTLENESALNTAAAALASDTVVHDQQACHSPQVVFVEGEAEKFADTLGKALDEAEKRLPRGEDTIDRKSQVGHLRNMAELMGERVFHPGSTAWTLIVTDNFERTATNPLGRTLWVLPVNTLDDAVQRADSWTMVAAFSDRSDLETHRDTLAALGVDRLTTVGRMGLLPPGTPHEGRYDLTRLVKFVSTDLPAEPGPDPTATGTAKRAETPAGVSA
jgi:long-chain-fatty-acyl-CoA reductase